jgi:hypothetical protein
MEFIQSRKHLWIRDRAETKNSGCSARPPDGFRPRSQTAWSEQAFSLVDKLKTPAELSAAPSLASPSCEKLHRRQGWAPTSVHNCLLVPRKRILVIALEHDTRIIGTLGAFCEGRGHSISSRGTAHGLDKAGTSPHVLVLKN